MLKVGLFDLGGKIPNLALMKISTYHRAMGDMVSMGSGGDLNYISCVFNKHRLMAEHIMEVCPNSVVGGPGWNPDVSLPPEINTCRPDYSLYGIDYGLGRLTAGCPSDCEYCVVPRTEGREVKTVASIGDISNLRGDLSVLLDANILAGADWTDHFREIQKHGGWVDFTQGLDIRMVTDLAAAEIAKLKITSLEAWKKAQQKGKRLRKGQVHFAWDRMENEQHVRYGIKLLSQYMTPDRLTFYMMVNYNTSWEEDWYRFEVLRSLRTHPFVMLYGQAPEKLHHFARWVNRRIYKVCEWRDYNRFQENQYEQLKLFA